MPLGSRAADRWEAERRRHDRQLLVIARSSFLFVGSLPWWLPLVRDVLGIAGDALDLSFVVLCHRLPERTLEIGHHAMPVCSRCGGIYLGLALGAVLMWPRLSLRGARWALFGAGLLMLIDVVTQDLGLHPVWHATRIATGALLGWVASSTLMAEIRRERGMLPRPR
ncbi:MAG: DUF2085 domain-containing protein [Myxococcota bacterium]